MIMSYKIFVLVPFLLAGCTVGPNYVRPTVSTPVSYKEAGKNWKIAQPQNVLSNHEWWEIFNDPQLNTLEDQLNASNQNIVAAEANYRQARALVDKARASYFPTFTGSATLTRQKQTSTSSASGVSTNHSLLLDASWETDLWGSVRRSVESSKAGAQISAAQLAATRLSEQASLAQFYFELRGLDSSQKLLTDTVMAYQKALQLTKNRYNAGVAQQTDILQAQTQLETAQAQALNNGINRAQLEHALAVLIGQPPANFSLAEKSLTTIPPQIPSETPSTLLERRPDIAQAERQMAQANANIGIAVAAYFPDLMLAATGNFQGQGYAHWLSLPLLSWSVGPQLAQTLFDGGARRATTAAVRANYEVSVATYRQTVLSAFQDVEDNLVALRILEAEASAQNCAATHAKQVLKLVTNQYKAGTVDYLNILSAQITAYTAEKNAADITSLRMTTAVALIKALGGSFG